MFINAYDMARFGYLFLRNGKWKDRSIVSEKWIQMARKPARPTTTYGFANWYLNTDASRCRRRRTSAVRFVGNGNNIVYIDWENDLRHRDALVERAQQPRREDDRIAPARTDDCGTVDGNSGATCQDRAVIHASLIQFDRKRRMATPSCPRA